MTLNLASFPIEAAQAQDPARDFCLWDYSPPCLPAVDAIRGVNLLYVMAGIAGSIREYRELVARLRSTVGAFRTVWGVKWSAGKASAEFYFYDYKRTERAVPFGEIAEAFVSVADVTIAVDEDLPFFMASVEAPLGLAATRPTIDVADIYIGNPDPAGISSGICYEIGSDGARLKNLYYFFDAQNDWNGVLAKAACSAHVPVAAVGADRVFPDWLREAQVAVVANKPLTDGAYFSRISIRGLIRFMEAFAYPAELIGFAKRNETRLRHLLFDVGYDYRVENGQVRFGKSSIYNVL